MKESTILYADNSTTKSNIMFLSTDKVISKYRISALYRVEPAG